MSHMEALIEDIRESYKHSNIKDLNLKEQQASVEQKIGYLLQKVPNLSNKNYVINFDPVETMFLNKLISEKILSKRFVVTKEEYFKSIVFVDFLTSYILNSTKILEDYLEMTIRLEKINPYLDPTLELITKYSALHFSYVQSKKYLSDPENQARKDLQKYREKNYAVNQDYIILRKLDPVHEALGNMVSNLIENSEVKYEMQNAQGVNDLKSLIFTDCVIKYIPNTNSIIEKIKEGNFYSASLTAMSELGKTITPSFVREYFRKIEEAHK